MYKNIIFGVGFAVIWALSFIFTQLALKDFPPLWLAGTRLIFSGLILFIIIRYYKKTRIEYNFKILLAGLFTQAIYLGASYWSLVNLPTSIVNIVVSTVPMVSIPIAYLYLKENVKPYELISFAICIFGVAVALSGKINNLGNIDINYIISISLLLISVISLAFGNALAKKELSQEKILEFCCLQFFTSGLILVFLAAYIEPMPNINGNIETIASIVFLVLFGSILGTILWFKLLFDMTMIGASSFFILTPMLGIIGGMLFFDESLSMEKIIGTIIISCAIFIRFYLGWYKKLTRTQM